MSNTAIHRATYEYYSGVSATLPTGLWLLNPDLSAVDGVPRIYWKVEGNSVLEMTQTEKNIKDLHLAALKPAAEPDIVQLDAKTTQDKRLRVAIEKSDGASADFYTHRWNDKTTWYGKAVKVTNYKAIDAGNHLTYALSGVYIIDACHGKIVQEDSLKAPGGGNYKISVTVNGSGVKEDDPHYASGNGDFIVDYESGNLTFHNALPANANVRANYYYATTSEFTIEPNPGKELLIEVVDVQFADDIEVTDSMVFDVYGAVEHFAPHLMLPAPTGMSLPSGYQIHLKEFKYKTMDDYYAAAIRSYTHYPPLGGDGWRGQKKKVHTLNWDYRRTITLHGNLGMKATLRLEHNVPFGGSYALATLYCGEEDDV